VYITRLIERDEQTEDDQSIIRIEKLRELKGTYYQKDGTGINFTITLESAMHSLTTFAGITLAAIGALAF